MLQESQKRALALLDALLEQERGKRRIKNDEAFLATAASRPRWDAGPALWARDWCAGWAFQPDYAHARALGIELARRSRVIGHYIEPGDGGFRPVPSRDAAGRIKKGKNSAVLPAPMSRVWMLWTQSTAFAFRAGYTVHSQGPASLQVLRAAPAHPADKDAGRDPGEVMFRIYLRENGRFAPGEIRAMSQDDFVRFLIRGDAA